MHRISNDRTPSLVRRALAGLSLILLPLGAAAQSGTVQDKTAFSAEVTNFQTSIGSNGLRFVTASLHFTNKTKKPLILACEPSKVTATDDKGNRYAGAMVRGIGTINGQGVDSKFILAPGAESDVLFEVRTRLDARTIRGTSFDLNAAVKEILPLASGQVKMGTEYSLEFTGLKPGLAEKSDGKPSVVAGPFTATIVHSKVSKTGRWQVIDMTISLKNTTDKPLILAYEYLSSFGIDDQGNRFGYGTSDRSVSGIGVVNDSKADPQFVLAPGEAKEAHFTIVRSPGREIAGTDLTYFVALRSLEILPSEQIRSTRQYSLTFTGLSTK